MLFCEEVSHGSRRDGSLGMKLQFMVSHVVSYLCWREFKSTSQQRRSVEQVVDLATRSEAPACEETLRHHYKARNWTFDENKFLVSSETSFSRYG